MNSRSKIVVLAIFIAALSLAACSSEQPAAQSNTAKTPSQPQPLAQAPTTPAAPPSDASTETTTGKLQNVDLTAKTMVIKDADGQDQTFKFSESTEIVGVAGAQGLSGEQGNQVIIHHVMRDGARQAVRIEITPK
jgi:ABC-type Fe3+-hydroxamate transport system substrate-binding protein